tara:strand:- start:667 stop:1518 length:852 start_codon:yes stop_codon:yes gene_type:complete
MNKKFIRIIPKLDIKNGYLIKGINLEGLRVLGNPYDFAKYYSESGADEIFFQDNVASLYGTNNLIKFINETAKNISIPLTVGGGVRTLKDIEIMLKNGADKVCINSEAIRNPKFINLAAKNFGSSTITALIETINYDNKYYYTHSSGRELVKDSPIKWAKELENLGAGEIFLTSVDKEGLGKGCDLDVIKKISLKAKIPVVAHGGIGNFSHFYDVISKTKINAVSASSIFHYNVVSQFKINLKKIKIGNTNFLENLDIKNRDKNIIRKIKKFLNKKKINIRLL